jgi:geranylgeranyl reductase family protein
MQKKIVIIGAGPVGCYTAQLLKCYGFNPIIIEEHSQVGRPIHCTGLIGNRLFKEIKSLPVSKSVVINDIDGATIHYNNQSFTLKREAVAYVVDRERFDQELSRGLDIYLEHRFMGLEKDNRGYVVETNRGEFYADIVIGSDGANSAVRKLMNQDNGVRYCKGLQLRMRTKPRNRNFVEVFLKKASFFWVVPEGEGIVRVGTISNNPYKDIQEFLKTADIKGEVVNQFGGLVSVGICAKTVQDNVALVGGAACQLKPLTYGGVYFGLKAAAILANCIKDDCISQYDLRWKKEFISEIKIGLKASDMYSHLDNKEIGLIFNLLKKQKYFIEKAGDFERHGNLLLQIIKNPAFYPQLGGLFKIFLKSLLH